MNEDQKLQGRESMFKKNKSMDPMETQFAWGDLLESQVHSEMLEYEPM